MKGAAAGTGKFVGHTAEALAIASIPVYGPMKAGQGAADTIMVAAQDYYNKGVSGVMNAVLDQGPQGAMEIVTEAVLTGGATAYALKAPIESAANTFKASPSAASVKTTGEPPQLKAGKEAHAAEPVRPGEKAEVRTPSGKRMDRYNAGDAHIREIKPNNARGVRHGSKQVNGYKEEMDKATGREHTTELTLYDKKK